MRGMGLMSCEGPRYLRPRPGAPPVLQLPLNALEIILDFLPLRDRLRFVVTCCALLEFSNDLLRLERCVVEASGNRHTPPCFPALLGLASWLAERADAERPLPRQALVAGWEYGPDPEPVHRQERSFLVDPLAPLRHLAEAVPLTHLRCGFQPRIDPPPPPAGCLQPPGARSQQRAPPITFELPSEVRLPELGHLVLTSRGWCRGLKLPPSFCSLGSLTSLEVTGARVGLAPKCLPPALRQLRLAQVFGGGAGCLKPTTPRELVAASQHPGQIHSLSLGCCQGQGCSNLAESSWIWGVALRGLSELTALTLLRLGPFPRCLEEPPALAQLTGLRELALEDVWWVDDGEEEGDWEAAVPAQGPAGGPAGLGGPLAMPPGMALLAAGPVVDSDFEQSDQEEGEEADEEEAAGALQAQPQQPQPHLQANAQAQGPIQAAPPWVGMPLKQLTRLTRLDVRGCCWGSSGMPPDVYCLPALKVLHIQLASSSSSGGHGWPPAPPPMPLLRCAALPLLERAAIPLPTVLARPEAIGQMTGLLHLNLLEEPTARGDRMGGRAGEAALGTVLLEVARLPVLRSLSLTAGGQCEQLLCKERFAGLPRLQVAARCRAPALAEVGPGPWDWPCPEPGDPFFCVVEGDED